MTTRSLQATRARARLLLVTLSLSVPCAAGACSKDEPPRPSGAPPAAPSEIASALGVDAQALAETVDPPAPAGDLRAEIDRFTTLDACVADKSAIDPLLGDALTAIGYDTFVVDACRILDAAKAKDAKRCEPIAASSLRNRCDRVLAVAAGDPELCPWMIPTRVVFGRDPMCMALAMREPRMCAGALRTERATCEATAARDEKKCDMNARDPDRASCRREVKRYTTLLASASAAAAGDKTPLPQANGKLEIHPLDGTTDTVSDSTDVADDLARGIVLMIQRDGVRFDVGELRELGTGFIAPSPNQRPHLGLTLYALTGIKDARVERAELGIPGIATLMTPGQRANLHVTVTKLEPKRGGEVVLTVEGEIGSSPHGFKVRGAWTTFVRDVVKPGAIPLPFPSLSGSAARPSAGAPSASR